MSKIQKQLYFVALVPPEPVHELALSLKRDVAEKFHSTAALRSPPHITLHMPFKWREDKEENVLDVLQSCAEKHRPMKISQHGFGSFSPRVIFINVEKTEELDGFRSELVRTMRRELKLENADFKDKAFHPHMTIAFRDLKKSVFPDAWHHYKEQRFDEEWNCDRFVLLKHNGQKWEVYRNFILGSDE